MTRAQTIDDVLEQLDAVIADSRRDDSRLGYFPALYRKVTARVQQGILAGEFEDGPRMERLDVTFANRYLDALALRRRGEAPTKAWDVAFCACDDWSPIVLQHLLLGMNAHINLDLGIAAARTAPGAELEALHADFNRINGVLASLVDDVKAELAQIWRPLGPLDRISGNIEDLCVNLSMTKARDTAWTFPTELAQQSPAEQAETIARRDRWTARFGAELRRPPVGQIRLLLIRLGERRDVAQNIQILT